MAAALALVSCSQDDLMTGIENRPTGAIGAKVFVPTVSRGTALNNEGDLVTAQNGFDLYAFLVKDNSQFMGAVADGNNVGVPFVGSGTEGSYVWNYENESQMRFWSEADESDIKFFAVSPKNALTNGFLTKTISHDSQAFAYTTPETCSEQVDLMYGVTAEPKYSSTTGEHLENGISLQFRHALSQIVFKAKTESELIYADVTAVKIKNVYKTGSFDVATAETYRTAEDKSTTTFPWKDYADLKDFTAQLGETAPTNINTTVDEEGNETTTSEKETGNYQDGRLTDSSEALLLIPQNLESNKAVLAITCSVRYKRGEGDEATIVDNQTIEVPVTTHWQPGYKYTYTLIFTAEMGNPIKVMTVGVDIWNDAGDTDVEVEGESSGETPEDTGILDYDDEVSSIKIRNENDLAMMRDLVNAGATYDIVDGQVITNTEGSGTYLYASASYIQTGPVDLSTFCGNGHGNWEPIGSDANNFMGSYNGNGFEIKNLYVDDDTANKDYALFGYLQYAYLSNITVSGEINSGDDAASIACVALEGVSIMNCVSSVNVTATNIASGIVSTLQSGSTLQGCINKGTVTANYANGIVDVLDANTANLVQACYNIGTINGGDRASGIIGSAQLGTIKSCYNAGQLSSSEAGSVAGILGMVYSSSGNDWFRIEKCYYSNAEQGIANNLLGENGDLTSKIEGETTWAVAAAEMNKSMPYGLEYSDYTGNDNEPLTFVTE